MRSFQLFEPRSINEACELLERQEDAKPIAGGTALLILIKQGVYLPTMLVNLTKVRGASAITYDPEEGLRIGALATISEVETAPAVRRYYPLLASASHAVANVRIRNLATIGGNLAHADSQSDPPTALLALEAGVELTSTHGTRLMPIQEFLIDSYRTALEPGEILSGLRLPVPPSDLAGTYTKFTSRSSEDRPCAGIALMLRMRDGSCDETRVVVGAASPTPIRIRRAEELARGRAMTPDVIEAMAAEAAEAVNPIDDLRGPAYYKRHLVRVLVRRALTSCVQTGGTR